MAQQFLWGALAMASGVAGTFFLRFFARSRERLFLAFAVSFWLLAINWTLLAVLNPHDESRHFVMGIRLLAFAGIIVGVIDKNRRA